MTRLAAPGVPVIDLSAMYGDDAAARADLVADVAEACAEIGFLVVAGHGVPQDAIDDVYRTSSEFFDLPLEEKLRVASPHGDPFHGYCPTTLANPGLERRPDLREMYHINRFDTPDDAIAAGYPADVASTSPPNLWPERPVDFKPAWQRYYAEMEAFTGRMLHVFALALGLPEDWFDDQVDRHLSNLDANCYPEQTEAPLPGQVRLTAHVDFSTLTILYQDAAPGGLEVRHRRLGWIPVPHVAGTYVVNLGDMMARWTNQRWVATAHRVVNPPAGATGTRRISIPFFHMPNHDAVIQAIPTCVAPGEAPKHPPITCRDWVLARRTGKVSSYDLGAEHTAGSRGQ